MAVYFVPSISPVDYPAFCRAFDGRLPDSFEEWRAVQDTYRRRLVPAGHHVVDMHIALADLAGYCRSADRRMDTPALNAFAARIGAEFCARDRSYRTFGSQVAVLDDTEADRVAATDIRPRPDIAEASEVGEASDIVEIPVAGDVAVRRRRWAFWSRRRTVTPLAVEAPETGATVVEDIPARRPWWAFWRRPQRARSSAARAV